MSHRQTNLIVGQMDTETKDKPHKLKVYLDQLPDSLYFQNEDDSLYGFEYFGLDSTDEEDIGVEGAVNRQLEIQLGHRNNGPVQLKERGPSIVAVISVLNRYLTKLPTSVILKKWVDDLICSAELVYEEAKCSVSDKWTVLKPGDQPYHPETCWQLPVISGCGSVPLSTDMEPDSELEDAGCHTGRSVDELDNLKSQPIRKKVKKCDTKILTTFDDGCYRDLPEVEDTRPAGAKSLALLYAVTRRCEKKNEPTSADSKTKRVIIRCIGSYGCNTTWAVPRNRQRILVHVSKCNWLPSKFREAALDHMGNNATGPVAIIPNVSESSSQRMTDDSQTETHPVKPRPGRLASKASNTLPVESYAARGQQELHKGRGGPCSHVLHHMQWSSTYNCRLRRVQSHFFHSSSEVSPSVFLRSHNEAYSE